MHDLVLPADLKESAQEITELEQALIAARATARDSGCYQYFVVNDCLDATIAQVEDIIQKETHRV